MDTKDIQKAVIENKVKHGFNTTDIRYEFCLLYGEVGEAFQAYNNDKPDLPEELADVAIYLLGISELLGVDLGAEVEKKMAKNAKRQYKIIDGRWQKFEGE